MSRPRRISTYMDLHETRTKKICFSEALSKNSLHYHPDQIAFDKLQNSLLPNYIKQFGKHAFDIVFYDMMTPCTTCAKRIVNDYRNIPETTNVGELRIIYTRLYKNGNKNSQYYDPDGTENLKDVRKMIADYNENAYPRPGGRAIKLNQEADLWSRD